MKMKAIVIHRPGGPEVLRFEDVPVPEMADGQLLIRVCAVSVNHLDMLMASPGSSGRFGTPFPWIPGFDFAGVVENAASGISVFRVGDKVFGNCPGGSYAEYVAVSPETVVRKPETLDFNAAASVPHVAETAWQAVHKHGRVKAGQKVLIHGAAGAVGAFAVQFARLAGARVHASVAGQDMDYVRGLGADVVIDYQTTDFTAVAKDMDLVIVLVGGNTQEISYSVLKRGGRLVSTTGPALRDMARAHGVTAVSMVIGQSGEDLARIAELIDAGKVRTDVAAVYALKDAMMGWELLAGTDPEVGSITRGKIVLEIRKEETV